MEPSQSLPNSSLDASEETRAAIDVMFEALAHIQASLETRSEEAREASYRNFKEGLYRRFEYLVQQRQSTGSESADGSSNGSSQSADALSDRTVVETSSGNAAGRGGNGNASPRGGLPDEDTLEKFWPAIAKSTSA
jgi:predicted ribonuclease toxin of YeeF-YezG toxin-antitoxin module